MSVVDIPRTYGALLIGGLFASMFVYGSRFVVFSAVLNLISSRLSGTVTLQTIVYFRLYPMDYLKIKLLVRLLHFLYRLL